MAVLLSCITCAVLAQAGAAPAAPAAASAPTYVSPFQGYRRFDAESPVKPWRQANEEVREAGGHVGILKGMSSPAAATAAGKSPAGGEAPKAPAATPDKPAAKPAGSHSHGEHK